MRNPNCECEEQRETDLIRVKTRRDETRRETRNSDEQNEQENETKRKRDPKQKSTKQNNQKRHSTTESILLLHLLLRPRRPIQRLRPTPNSPPTQTRPSVRPPLQSLPSQSSLQPQPEPNSSSSFRGSVRRRERRSRRSRRSLPPRPTSLAHPRPTRRPRWSSSSSNLSLVRKDFHSSVPLRDPTSTGPQRRLSRSRVEELEQQGVCSWDFVEGGGRAGREERCFERSGRDGAGFEG